MDRWINTYLVAGNQTSARAAHAMPGVRYPARSASQRGVGGLSCGEWLQLSPGPREPCCMAYSQAGPDISPWTLRLPASVNDTERWGERAARPHSGSDRPRPAGRWRHLLSEAAPPTWPNSLWICCRGVPGTSGTTTSSARLEWLVTGRALAEAFTAEPGRRMGRVAAPGPVGPVGRGSLRVSPKRMRPSSSNAAAPAPQTASCLHDKSSRAGAVNCLNGVEWRTAPPRP